MFKTTMLSISCFLFLSVTACAPTDQAAEMDYDQTKKMVVDILKTDDGKKAIQEILNDDKLNETLVMDEKTVKETVEKTMTSKKGAEFWKKVFEDPKFAEGFAKTLQNEHEKVLKKLMKDPEYQKMLMQVMQDPEMTKKYGELVRSQEFRTHLQEVISDTLSSPLYRKQFEEELKKAASESMKEEMKGGEEKQS
ncbi:spore germination lipoprotein GerD [Bacillus paralicheniformis]|uniref:Spore germination lipoprotein GerD n=3 Tax=Bacillus paralicheniformis TaxID=1648923 RepID=A0AAW6KGN7_9BACI|nr:MULTISPECIES: spore germination lipoprotein GerD [Bacillus]KUL13552.1 spore germination protein GerD [Bacillus licheniformis LMG 7559]KUL17727.1 spore germination protein GerD [Bacillus licheniformis LMG 6934]AGN34620.1 spore germination protein GerD [Bacillus paralicheniformis ATCC 9945a]ARA84155.1 spore gernimation protein GerD [Bacillus paralicheniformis]AYQ14773.1 spore gernimation protein GerD [Bacillus paralicheniformis]